MKVYIELIYKVHKEVKTYSSIIHANENTIFEYIKYINNKLLTEHGSYSDVKKAIEFISESEEEQKILEQRLPLYQKMLSVGLPYMNMYQSDLLFHDKITLFTQQKTKFLWCLNPTHTHLLDLGALNTEERKFNTTVLKKELQDSKTLFFTVDTRDRIFKAITKEKVNKYLI